MKKQKFLFVLLTLLIAGCSKTAIVETARDEPLTADITQLRTEADPESRIQFFNLLSAQERFDLWQQHLTRARDQFVNAGITAKYLLVEKLLSNISVTLFSDKAGVELDVFLNFFAPTWKDHAQKVFTEQELYDLTFDPFAEKIGVRPAPPEIGTTPDPIPSCFCHVGTSGYACRKISVGFPSGVTITNGICEFVGDCRYNRRGCGFLWLYSCNGSHCNF